MTFDEKASTVLSSISHPLICFWDATAKQLKQINEAYISLWSSIPTEDQAREIYDSLIAIALSDNKPYPIDWLLAEIRFEAFAAATGNREWAALMDLEHGPEVIQDDTLDLCNERISRVLS